LAVILSVFGARALVVDYVITVGRTRARERLSKKAEPKGSP
jgi:hypothetical protein